MRGVMFGNKHSYHRWGLMLKSRPVISPPTPKTKYVDVPGADGAIDMTETLTGYAQYENRKITFEFVLKADRDSWSAIYSDLLDYLHGKNHEIIMDEDPNFYYYGRVTVNKWNVSHMIPTVTMTAEVEPYKTARFSDPRYTNLTVDKSLTVALYGMRKPTVPVFSVSADMQLAFNGKTYTLPAGESKIPDVVIREGANTLVFTGNGTVSIDYRGGRF